MQVQTLQEKFGLKTETYTLDPIKADQVAFNDAWAHELYRHISRLIVTGVAPKVVFIHMRGDGKTHISNWIANKIKIVEKVYVECPAMTRGSGYLTLHRAILSEMYRANILSRILDRVWKEATETGLAEKAETRHRLMAVLEDKDLTSVFQEYKSANIEESDFYKYLRGEKIKTTSAFESIDSNRAVQVLKIFANLYQKFFNKLLFLIIDEVDNITEARQGARDFKEAFRKLAEVRNLGLIFIVNLAPDDAVTLDAVPSPLKDRGVQTRIGLKNYLLEPKPMQPDDIEPLIIKVNQHLCTDKTKEIMRSVKKDYGNDFSNELYPFTKRGFVAFKKQIIKYQERTKEDLLPRSVLNYANECLGEAVLSDKSAVDSDVVKAVGDFNQ